MYQMTTHVPLAESKKYFDSIKQCAMHFAICLKETNKYLKIQDKKPLELELAATGIRLFRLDLDRTPTILSFLGQEKPISTHNLEIKDVHDGRVSER